MELQSSGGTYYTKCQATVYDLDHICFYIERDETASIPSSFEHTLLCHEPRKKPLVIRKNHIFICHNAI